MTKIIIGTTPTITYKFKVVDVSEAVFYGLPCPPKSSD